MSQALVSAGNVIDRVRVRRVDAATPAADLIAQNGYIFIVNTSNGAVNIKAPATMHGAFSVIKEDLTGTTNNITVEGQTTVNFRQGTTVNTSHTITTNDNMVNFFGDGTQFEVQDSGAADAVVTVLTNGTAAGVTKTGKQVDIRTLSGDANNSLSIGSDGGLFFNATEQNVVANIAARDALTNVQTGELALVTDASADATVNNGGALYVWNGTAWAKIAEFESLDLTLGAATAVSPAADNGTGAVGTSTRYAREDHKHPVQIPSNQAGNSITLGTDGRHYLKLDGSAHHVVRTNAAQTVPPTDVEIPTPIEGDTALVFLTDKKIEAWTRGATAWTRNEIIDPITPDASETVKGKIELATDTEALAGTAADKGLVAKNVGALRATAVSPGSSGATGQVGTSQRFAKEDHRHPAQGTSTDANNIISTGTDGLHYAKADGSAHHVTRGNATQNVAPTAVEVSNAAHGDTAIVFLNDGQAEFWTRGAAAWARDTIKQVVAKDATLTQKGIVELATDAETVAKTDATRAVTPKNLAAVTATAEPVKPTGAAKAVGTSAKFAKEDHKHEAQDPSADANNSITKGVDGLHYVRLDGHSAYIVRANATQNTAPSAGEMANQKDGDTAIVFLTDKKVEYWRRAAGAWARVTMIDPLVPAATTTAQGIVELATTAETLAGTDATRAVTPAGLEARKAGATPQEATQTAGAIGTSQKFAKEDHRHPAQKVSTTANNDLKNDATDGRAFLDFSSHKATAAPPKADSATGAVGASEKYAAENHKHPAQSPSANANNRTKTGTDGLHFTPSEIVLSATDLAGTAPVDAKFGINYTSGKRFYVSGGNWTQVPTVNVDINTTVSDQSASNYGGGAPAAAPATADTGDTHIEIYKDKVAYFTATAANTWPSAAQVTEVRNNWTFATGAPTRADDNTGATGSSSALSRSDHKHPVQDPSGDANNMIVKGGDGRHRLLTTDMISGDARNGLVNGTDNKLFAPLGLKDQTIHHAAPTPLAITPAHDRKEIHVESTGNLTLDGNAITNDAFTAIIVNTTGAARTLTVTNVAGMFNRNNGTLIDISGTGYTVPANMSVIVTVTLNGAQRFVNITGDHPIVTPTNELLVALSLGTGSVNLDAAVAAVHNGHLTEIQQHATEATIGTVNITGSWPVMSRLKFVNRNRRGVNIQFQAGTTTMRQGRPAAATVYRMMHNEYLEVVQVAANQWAILTQGQQSTLRYHGRVSRFTAAPAVVAWRDLASGAELQWRPDAQQWGYLWPTKTMGNVGWVDGGQLQVKTATVRGVADDLTSIPNPDIENVRWITDGGALNNYMRMSDWGTYQETWLFKEADNDGWPLFHIQTWAGNVNDCQCIINVYHAENCHNVTLGANFKPII